MSGDFVLTLAFTLGLGQTILNNIDDGCVISLPLIATITALTVALTIFVTHRPEYRSNKARRVHNA